MLKTVLSLSLLLLAGQVAADCAEHSAADSDFPDSLVTTDPTPTGATSTWYDGATGRYAHGVLGDAIEPSVLYAADENNCAQKIVLDTDHVFEDLSPRLANIDGKPGNEIVTIRSHQRYGAQIAVYQLQDNTLSLLTTTPYIGTSNRWLAPVGIADFNNDNEMDIAFVDRPHLAKVLRVWSYRDGELVQIANKSGYSNHRIGEAFISGGIKQCNEIVTMITADAFWSRVLETQLKNGELVSDDVGPFAGQESLNQALQCN